MKSAHRLYGTPVVVLFLVGSLAPQRATPIPPPGTTAGQAIGTAIKTAISTAFPAIGTVINTIWGTDPNKNKKQTDATAATANLQQQSTQALAQVAKVSADLNVVTLFLSNCVVAENNIVAMRTKLQGKTAPLNATDKLQLQNYWSFAEGRIQRCKALEPPSIPSTIHQ